MATIATLAVEVSADIGGLESGMSRAESTLGDLTGAASGLDSGMGGLAGAMSAALDTLADVRAAASGAEENITGLSGAAGALSDSASAVVSGTADAAQGLTGMQDASSGLAGSLDGAETGLVDLAAGMGGADAAARETASVLAQVDPAAAGAADSLAETADHASDTDRSFWALINETWQLDEAMSTVKDSLDSAGDALQGFATGQQDNRVEAGHLSRQMGITSDEYREFAASLSDATFPLQDVHALVDQAIIQGEEGEEAIAQFALTWDMLGDATGESGPELAKAGMSLRSIEEEGWQAHDSMDAFGHIVSEMGREALPEFFRFVDRNHESLNDLGLNTDGAAVAMTALKDETGLSGRTLRREFRNRVDEADGDLGEFLATMDLTVEEFEEMQGATSGAGSEIELMADDVADSMTPLEELQSWAADMQMEFGPLADLAGMLAVPLLALGPLVSGLSRVFSLLRLAFLATPVGWIIGGLLLIGVGIQQLWERSETFRDIVTGVWRRVGEVWEEVQTEILMPLLREVREWWDANGPAIKEAALEAWNAISEGLTELKNEAEPVLEELGSGLISNIGEAALEGFRMFAGWWEANGDEVLATIVAWAEGIGEQLRNLAAWWEENGDEVIRHAKAMWTASVIMAKFIFSAIGFVVRSLLWLRDTWRSVRDRVEDFAGGIASATEGMRDRALGAIDALTFGMIGSSDEAHRELVGNSIWPAIASGIVNTMRGMSSDAGREFEGMTSATLTESVRMQVQMARVFTEIAAVLVSTNRAMTATMMRDTVTWAETMTRAFTTMGAAIVRAMADTVRGVDASWSRLPGVMAPPVRYMVNPVYQRGFRPVWNQIAGRVPDLSAVGAVRGFADGGITDARGGGRLPGFAVRDDTLVMARSGEGILTPEATRGLGGSAFIDAANTMGARAREMVAGLPGFQRGGVVGLARGFDRAGQDYYPDGVVRAVNDALVPMAGLLGGRFGRGDDVPGAPYHAARAWASSIAAVAHAHKGLLEGGDGMAVVEEARKHVGLSGRPNEFTRPYMAGSWPWCGAFVGGVFKRANAYNALDAVDWKPLVRSYRTLPTVGRGSLMPGDLALYRADDGHINIVTDPDRSETVGGNESDAVRRNFGYMNSASSFRRPAYARGGVVEDAAAFWNQNRVETRDALTPHRDQVMRDLFDEFNGTQSFDEGGYLPPGLTLAHNGTGRPEPVGHGLDEAPRVIIDLRGDDDDMIRRLRKRIQIDGGGDVQVALGGRR